MEDYVVISNPHQRKTQGGRPAIVVNVKKYNVENLTQTSITIPWGVEAIWVILSPKQSNNNSLIKKIVVGCIYSKPKSRKMKDLHDHIADVYHSLSAKYLDGLSWILCGDTNELRLDPILHLSPKFRQCVDQPTRYNPPAILDPIITDLHTFYQTPVCEDPLQVDQDKVGSDSDHLMVTMTPLSTINNHVVTVKKRVEFRPLTDEGFKVMENQLQNLNWDFIEDVENRDKLKVFQDVLFSIFTDCFPMKSRLISNRNEPFYTDKLGNIKRKKLREFNKHRRSEKYIGLERLYKTELKKAKQNFYANKIKHLKSSNPRQWYKNLKMLTKYDEKDDKLIVENIRNFSDEKQAELIADKFAQVSNEYDILDRSAIEIPSFTFDDIPRVSESEVKEVLENLKTNKSERKTDIPSKVFKKFSQYLSKPLSLLINNAIVMGHWPEFLKVEHVTPIPKVSTPKDIDDLRNISGLMNLDKIMEKIICKWMIDDMKDSMDPSQYANQKGLSTQHYLVKMLDRILSTLDNSSKGESVAILATMFDWKQAFPRQCPTLGIQSFIRNGVRPGLIPILISYFEDRKMVVKWHGILSKERNLKGGGPQGSTIGILEYLSQSNDNANSVPESDRFKFVDDLTVLEIVYLLNIGMASHNIKLNVSSKIPIHNQFIPRDNLRTQEYVRSIETWTEQNKMILNPKKTKNQIFNFSTSNQFVTDIKMKNETLEIVEDAKLLGTIISSDLSWNKNTEEIVKKANQRMRMLHAAAKFTSKISDLKTIYKMFIRSSMEYNSAVWHSSLTEKNTSDLERIQKTAAKVILKSSYENYEKALKLLDMETLEKRREKLCLSFAKKCLKSEKMNTLFPENQKTSMKTRNQERFKVNFANRERYRKSTIPYLQRMLNSCESEKEKIIRNIGL